MKFIQLPTQPFLRNIFLQDYIYVSLRSSDSSGTASNFGAFKVFETQFCQFYAEEKNEKMLEVEVYFTEMLMKTNKMTSSLSYSSPGH